MTIKNTHTHKLIRSSGGGWGLLQAVPRGPLSHNQSTVPGNVFSVLFEIAPCADCCVYKNQESGRYSG